MKRCAVTLIILMMMSLYGCSNYVAGTPTASGEIKASAAPVIAEQSSAAANEQESASIVYKNNQYGFTFTLPAGWKGYTIVSEEWQGISPTSGQAAEAGPKLSIRHPAWKTDNPRQDIPILIFTIKQWDEMQNDVFHIGAAPINPSELGRNSKYVFALPARYNYAFPTGYEEVDVIFKGKPLTVNENFS